MFWTVTVHPQELKCYLKLNQRNYIVYLVGLYIYCKMIHGPYNVKLKYTY